MLKGHEDTVKGMVFAPLNQHNPGNVLASGAFVPLSILPLS